MYYVTFDESNKINGFFNDNINNTIPESAITISDDKWQELSENPEQYIFENGQIVAAENPQLQVTATPLINWNGFNNAMQDDTDYDSFIANATNENAVRRLESLAITLGATDSQNTDITGIQTLWNMVAESVESNLLTNSSVPEKWSVYAQSNNLPFVFDNNFKMVKTQ